MKLFSLKSAVVFIGIFMRLMNLVNYISCYTDLTKINFQYIIFKIFSFNQIICNTKLNFTLELTFNAIELIISIV